MALIRDESRPIFDLSEIEAGYAIYAKHQSWSDGHSGLVTRASDELLVVMFYPSINNVINHFTIPAGEVSNGEWEVRWSKDLTNIGEYTPDSDNDVGTGGDVSGN